MSTPAATNAWASGNLAKRIRERHSPQIETKKITLTEGDYNQDFINQTVQLTLTGEKWNQVRNEQVIRALKEKGINTKSIVAAWKTDKVRYLYITFNSLEASQAAADLREFEIGNVKARIRGKSTTLEVQIH